MRQHGAAGASEGTDHRMQGRDGRRTWEVSDLTGSLHVGVSLSPPAPSRSLSRPPPSSLLTHAIQARIFSPSSLLFFFSPPPRPEQGRGEAACSGKAHGRLWPPADVGGSTAPNQGAMGVGERSQRPQFGRPRRNRGELRRLARPTPAVPGGAGTTGGLGRRCCVHPAAKRAPGRDLATASRGSHG